MTAEKAPEQGRLGSSVWRLLTVPLASSQPPGEYRRRAPLLSAFLLILVLMTSILNWVASSGDGLQPARVAALVGLVSAYALSRTRFYAFGAGLTLIMLALPSYVSVLTDTDHSEIAIRAHLVWLVLPVLLSSALLSIRGTVIVAGMNLVAIVALPPFEPAVSLRSVLGSLGFCLTTSALVIAFRYYRDRLEKVRQVELQESEQHYRALFERTDDAVFIVGLDGTYIDANHQPADLLDYSRAELTGMSFREVITPKEHGDSELRLAGHPLHIQYIAWLMPPIFLGPSSVCTGAATLRERGSAWPQCSASFTVTADACGLKVLWRRVRPSIPPWQNAKGSRNDRREALRFGRGRSLWTTR